MSKRDKPPYDHTTGEGQKRILYDAHNRVHGREPGDNSTRKVDTNSPGDYGCDPLGDGTFRMVPSGDIVDLSERNRRLGGL